MSAKRDLAQMLDLIQQQGWEITKRRNGHLRVAAPGGNTTIVSSTPSDSRSVQNVRSVLRRMGAQLPGNYTKPKGA